nr:protein FAR1-RELATED SEQUENCE 5-like [Ipomoea batatas]
MARSDMEGDGASMETNDSGSEESGLQETECEMEISPDGTKLWIPNANPEETPYIGQKFQTVEEGVEFYKAYAKAVGFDLVWNGLQQHGYFGHHSKTNPHAAENDRLGTRLAASDPELTVAAV